MQLQSVGTHCYLELATVHHIHHILNGQTGFSNIGGDHNLAHAGGRALEGLSLIPRGHRGVEGDDPLAPLPVLGCAGQPLLQR